ncbi:MAG: peptide-binding protein [Candidatus Magnetoovum sp. WYHC-5]|nr:peptide-binding protein [Candidatus Magnetoovum sp. WYHC-5]
MENETTVFLEDEAPANSQNYKERYGGTLVDSIIGEPSVLIPMLASDASSHEIAGLIYEGLVKYDTDLSVIGSLAESWDISSDNLTITFHLRHRVKWTDSIEFTAWDVLYGYQTIISDKTPSAYKGDYLEVASAEVLDNYTFRVTYKRPFASALTSWGNLVVLPKHLIEGTDITKSPLTRQPIGLGPYKLEKWVSGQELVLVANDDYYEGRPYIDKYVYRIIPDQATTFLEAKAGNVDITSLTPIQFSRQTESIQFKAKYNKYRYPLFNYTYLGFNLKHPFFKDKSVRQAIAHAIDKQEMVDVVLFGLGVEATGPYVPNTWPYNPNIKAYEYNISKSKAMLERAGWVDNDGDGIIEKDGLPFDFTILTNMGNTSRLKTATILQWRLKQVGINVHIRAVEWSTFLNEFINKRRFDAVVMGWSIGLDPDQYDIWHSSKTAEHEFNFVSYANSEVDKLLEEGRITLDVEKRKAIYYQVQDILAEDLPYIFLYVPDSLVMLNKKIKGIKPSPIGIGYNQRQWFIVE